MPAFAAARKESKVLPTRSTLTLESRIRASEFVRQSFLQTAQDHYTPNRI